MNLSPIAWAVVYYKRLHNVVEDRIELFKTEEAAKDFAKRVGCRQGKKLIPLVSLDTVKRAITEKTREGSECST